jgi:hypothetical protein
MARLLLLATLASLPGAAAPAASWPLPSLPAAPAPLVLVGVAVIDDLFDELR